MFFCLKKIERRHQMPNSVFINPAIRESFFPRQTCWRGSKKNLARQAWHTVVSDGWWINRIPVQSKPYHLIDQAFIFWSDPCWNGRWRIIAITSLILVDTIKKWFSNVIPIVSKNNTVSRACRSFIVIIIAVCKALPAFSGNHVAHCHPRLPFDPFQGTAGTLHRSSWQHMDWSNQKTPLGSPSCKYFRSWYTSESILDKMPKGSIVGLHGQLRTFFAIVSVWSSIMISLVSHRQHPSHISNLPE